MEIPTAASTTGAQNEHLTISGQPTNGVLRSRPTANSETDKPTNGYTHELLKPDIIRRESEWPTANSETDKPTNGYTHELLKPDIIRRESEWSTVSSGRSTPAPEDALPSERSIKHARKERRRRLFPTVDYENRVSHFDPDSSHRDFRGFFTLFWIGLVIMVITASLKNLRDTRSILRTSIFSLFTEKLWELGLAEAAMVASTVICLPIQKLVQQRGLVWEREGYLLQHLLQSIWLGVWVYLPFFMEWKWTHQVFFTLHALTLLMKIHSYSFYCGHLSTTEQRLKALDANNTKKESQEDSELREALAFELTSPTGNISYPHNLTLENYIDYLLCPTLCYELSYPRTEKVRWGKVAEKAAAVFGCIFLLTITSEEFILPTMMQAADRLEHAVNLMETGLIMLESISLLLFPFMVTFLLVFLVIFEYVLGAFAEITCFADRHFYSDWWNSTNWLEFSREWNIPVHRFLQRHVYGASRPHMSRPIATLVTFLISALAHELVMFCITKKLRGYGFVCQMLQLPIIVLQRSRFMRDQLLLNNIMFWISMIWGLSMISALYVLI